MKAQLSDDHLKMLREGSGISDDAIETRGYKTITDGKELVPLGFSAVQRRTPGLRGMPSSPRVANQIAGRMG